LARSPSSPDSSDMTSSVLGLPFPPRWTTPPQACRLPPGDSLRPPPPRSFSPEGSLSPRFHLSMVPGKPRGRLFCFGFYGSPAAVTCAPAWSPPPRLHDCLLFFRNPPCWIPHCMASVVFCVGPRLWNLGRVASSLRGHPRNHSVIALKTRLFSGDPQMYPPPPRGC